VSLKRIDGSGVAVEHRVLELRGQKVMLDRDLAWLYGVEPSAIADAVAQHPQRFPSDFAFRLQPAELEALSERRLLPVGELGSEAPLAFTELGLAMLSSVLPGERATEANVAIMRAFVRLRHEAHDAKALRRALEEIEGSSRGETERLAVLEAIRTLVGEEPVPPERRLDAPG
jgi:hypothetical protein